MDINLLMENSYLLVFIPLWFILAIIPYGYSVRVVQWTILQNDGLPRFENWKRLSLLGVKGRTIYAIYLYFGVQVLNLFIPLPFEHPVISFLVFMYFYPAVMTSFAINEDLGSGLPHRLDRSILLAPTYAVGAVTSALIGVTIYITSVFAYSYIPYYAYIAVGWFFFYLFIAQHYVIGQAWYRVGLAETQSISGGTISSDTGDLPIEDIPNIRGRFEPPIQAPSPTATEQLKVLQTLYDRGVFTQEEFEAKQQEIVSAARQTDSELDTTKVDRETTPTTRTGTGDDVDAVAETDRHDRSETLKNLYKHDAITKEEYRAKEQEVRSDHETREISKDAKSDLAERFKRLKDLYNQGHITEEEYNEKRRDLLEEI